jgi:hypothetical protein
MKYHVCEEVRVYNSSKAVWNMWTKMNNWPSDEKVDVFTSDKKMHVIDEKNKRSTFKIEDVIKGKSFKMVWYSFLMDMIFFYEVKDDEKDCIVTCRVNLRGFFSLPIRYFLKRKIQKHLSFSLREFANKLSRY